MTTLFDRRLLFVTGKGGVGKSSIASALALLAAEHGKRTLLCELDAKGDVADFLQTPPLTFEERRIAPNLSAMAMDPEPALLEYLRLQLHAPKLPRSGSLSRILEFVSTAAPGVREVVTIGKLCHEATSDEYDLVVVDASASGHIVSQLASPASLRELVGGGPLTGQTEWMTNFLQDPAKTGVCVVATPEEMPVTEAVELIERLHNESRVDLAGIIINQVQPELFGRSEEAVFEGLSSGARWDILDRELDDHAEELFDAARLAVAIRRTGVDHLKRLREAAPQGVSVSYVPYVFARSHGMRSTRALADALASELA